MQTMTSRERVLTTLNKGVPDRVPVNYDANAEIDLRLKKHFGLAKWDFEGIRKALGVDFRPLWIPFAHEPLHPAKAPSGATIDPLWGIRTRWVEHGTGGYWDFCEFPLAEATEDEVARWLMPTADMFDYSKAAETCRSRPDMPFHVGGAGLGDIINSATRMRGMEQVLVDLATDDPAGLLLIERMQSVNLERTRRTLEAAEGLAAFVWLGEDLGTQIAPLISKELYRRHIKPYHRKYVELAKAHNLPVMIHTCGSSSWAYEDFIEIGIDAVDTLQPEAANMSPEYLKKTFGGRLAFHGCISTAGELAFGNVDAVTGVCRRTLEIMMPGGGYCFAPTHSIQDNTPTENVLAMYEAARRFGSYG